MLQALAHVIERVVTCAEIRIEQRQLVISRETENFLFKAIQETPRVTNDPRKAVE